MKVTGSLLPPKWWNGSDGCSSVPDYHYERCCKGHDWLYRHAEFRKGVTDKQARKFADRRLRSCMKRANRETAPSGLFGRIFHWLRWSWRPHVWHLTLRLVGNKAWRPLDERKTPQPHKVKT